MFERDNYYQKYAKRTLERADITAEILFLATACYRIRSDAEPLEKWKATVFEACAISAGVVKNQV